MLILLRIIFGALFLYGINQARANAHQNPETGDLTNAFWLATDVILAVACALVWAPYFGEKVAEPLAGGMVQSAHIERKSRLLKWVSSLEARGWHRFAAWLCFIEGVRTPWLPGPFVMGLKSARRGSWLEKVYAREVFKFNNAENCVNAFHALQRHGIDPRPQKSPDVNIVLLSLERSVKPDPEVLHLQAAPPPPQIERDPRIQLGRKEA
jgi:hypothetical protein